MDTHLDVLTPEKFHEILHTDINKPVQDFRKNWDVDQERYVEVHTGAHLAQWAEAIIFLKQKLINVQVYLNFKKNDLTDSDYNKLKKLACEGIRQYWSRNINISGTNYIVWVQAHHRPVNAIPVDL